MRFPPSSPVHQLPRYRLKDGAGEVRAGPIVEVWPQVPAVNGEPEKPALAIVRIDSERHAIPVGERFFEPGWPGTGTVLVVGQEPYITWEPRVDFEKRAVRVNAG
jgi:hypothetical protein